MVRQVRNCIPDDVRGERRSAPETHPHLSHGRLERRRVDQHLRDCRRPCVAVRRSIGRGRRLRAGLEQHEVSHKFAQRERVCPVGGGMRQANGKKRARKDCDVAASKWCLAIRCDRHIDLGSGEHEYDVPETSLELSAPPSPLRGRRRSQAPADSDDEASPRPPRRRSPRIESQRQDSDGDDAYQARDDQQSDDEDEEGDSSDVERDDNYDDPHTIRRHFSTAVIAETCTLVRIDDNPSIPANLVPLSHLDAYRYLRRARDQPLLVLLYEPQHTNGRGEADFRYVNKFEQRSHELQQLCTLYVLREFISDNCMEWYRQHFSADGHLDRLDHVYEDVLDDEERIVGCKITLRGRLPEDINLALTDLQVLVDDAPAGSAIGLW